jgi:amino acid adenylation domain-containing protein
VTAAKGERTAEVTADVSLIGHAGPGGQEAVCRAAFAELLRRYGDVGGVFSWNGAAPHPAGTAPESALRLELTLADGRISGTIALTGPDLEAVLPERSAAHYLTLLATASGAADELGAVDVLTPQERQEIAAANGEPIDPDTLRPWPELVAGHAARTPSAIAVRYEDHALSYAELERRANQLAALLRASGIDFQASVALCLPRGERMVVAALGVLKAGACYVPLDPADPAARRNEILRDSGARIVVAAACPIDNLPGGVALIQLDARFTALADQPDVPLAVPLSGGDAAYLLYTSGSTGRPKGVLVEHRQLAAYVAAIVRRFGIDRPRSYALVQPLTVDSSVTALAVALATGGEVHVLSRERALDAAAFADWMRRHDVDCLKIAPSHLRALQGSPRFAELLPSWLLIVGGEASSWRWLRDLQRAHPRLQIVNHYGPTETTVGVLTLAVAEHLDAQWSTAPIGVSLPGTTITVADPAGREVPVGIAGELVIGGAQVARGYQNATERSGFVETGIGRRYRTGDRARRLVRGTVTFLGRDDDQVKVHGFRIELGEIDAALAEHPAVREAASAIDADVGGVARIIAYVVPSDVDTAALRAHLKARLSPHMVPRVIVPMNRLPLTPHGKLDRGSLPPPGPGTSANSGVDAVAPGARLEHVVAAVWCDLLGVAAVGPEQNFFEVGGHSLLLVDLQNRLCREAGKEVELLDLLQHPTVRGQAQLLSGTHRGMAPPRRSALQAALARRRQQLRGRGIADD